MDICRRLRQIREAKGLSQGDIERRTGLFRCYVSQVEGGHTIPRVATLEKWVKALGLSLAEFFNEDRRSARTSKAVRMPFYEQQLLDLLKRLSERDKQLLVFIADSMVKQAGKHGRPK